MRKILFGLALTAMTAAPASAGVVFSDNFDAENGGNTALNYTGFANFNSVGGGDVDLVAMPNGFGIVCSGSCVDLDGSPGPGEIISSNSFSFSTGDFVRLSFDVSGNQRNGDTDGYFFGFEFAGVTDIFDYGFNLNGTDNVIIPNTSISNIQTSTSIGGNDPFATRSVFFTAGSDGMLNFRFGSSSADNIGPLLDNIVLEIGSPVPEPATWAMMIAGFGLVGGAMRRRRKLTAAQPALA